jgi:hypothetical protein
VKKIALSILVILASLNATSSNTAPVEVVCSTFFNDKNSSYSIVVRPGKTSIVGGQSIEFEVYITGFGGVKEPGKLYASYPINFVDEDKNHTRVDFLDLPKHLYDIREMGGIKPSELINESILFNASGIVIKVHPLYFNQIRFPEIGCPDQRIRGEIKAEYDKMSYAPYTFKINVSENVKVGDNHLKFVLTYNDGEGWSQDKEVLTIHIKEWYEKSWDQFFMLLKGIVASLVIIEAYGWLKGYRERWLGRRKVRKSLEPVYKK